MVLCAAGAAWGKEPDTTADSRETCTNPQIEQPFLAFDDDRDYVLAPGGAFEDPLLSGWNLQGGAAVDGGNEPFQLRGGEDQMSLVLPAGASATSPTMCVDLHWPTMRFAALQEDEHDEDLEVEVLYPEVTGHETKWHKVKSLKARRKDGWHATKDIKVSPERGGKIPGGRPVAFRFTSDSDRGTWRIDNVYVDPRRK